MNYTSLEHFATLAYPVARRENFKEMAYSGVETFHVDRVVAEKSDLSASQFTAYLRDIPRAFVWFYAPWCGHCVRSQPEFEAAARESSTPFVAYNADQPNAQAIARKFKVQGFPTFVLVEHGEPVKWFDDARAKAAFVRFAK
jgi:thiol-disulfide isomerase/thioredoxin